MEAERIFSRKTATRVLSNDEIGVVAGGSGNWPTNPTYCAGPQGNPGDWAAGIVYSIEDDCGWDT